MTSTTAWQRTRWKHLTTLARAAAISSCTSWLRTPASAAAKWGDRLRNKCPNTATFTKLKMKTNPKNNTSTPLPADNGGEGTPLSLLDSLLDRNPSRKNGERGSYRLRLLLIDTRNMVGRKVRLGLRTRNLTLARWAAWIAISALRNAGVQLGNIVLDAQGRQIDLNLVEPPRGMAGDVLESGSSTRAMRARKGKAAGQDAQGLFGFMRRLIRSRKKD